MYPPRIDKRLPLRTHYVHFEEASLDVRKSSGSTGVALGGIDSEHVVLKGRKDSRRYTDDKHPDGGLSRRRQFRLKPKPSAIIGAAVNR